MSPQDTIWQIYLATTVFGWGFIIVSFFMGGFADHHQGGDSSHSHAIDHAFDPGHGSPGHIHMSGHGGVHGHSGHVVQGGDGHTTGSHHDHGDDARTGANVLVSAQRTTGYFKLMGILNPTSISVFIGFFGLTGMILTAVAPWLGLFTLIPSAGLGVVAVVLMRNIFAYMTAKLNVSNTIRGNDAIGHTADVSAPIGVGQTGEVTYVIGTTRFNSAARCVSTDATDIKRGSKVIIVNKEGHVVYVEPFHDDLA